MSSKDREEEIIDILKSLHSHQEKKKALDSNISQTITSGNNNTLISGDNNKNTINIKAEKKPALYILPSSSSIGGNPTIKSAITERFNRLGDERKKRFKDTAFSVMYANFKKDFGIKHGPWTIIWDWPIATADPIIKYLDDLYSNTIQGRLKNAAKKEGYIDTKPHLFRKEKELLSVLGLTTKSPEVVKILNDLFGVTSHAYLTKHQLWHLVCHLESIVKTQIGEYP
jgi:hypothetical protein